MLSFVQSFSIGACLMLGCRRDIWLVLAMVLERQFLVLLWIPLKTMAFPWIVLPMLEHTQVSDLSFLYPIYIFV